MRPVFLTGYMASGKTTLGRALAAAVPALSFVDLDEEIESRAGCSISDIFARDGEEAFRLLESEVLRDIARPDTVIACGGGTPCRYDNSVFMTDAGTVVHLEASVDIVVRRLLEAPAGQRPLVSDCHADPALLRTRVAEMMAARRSAYAHAHHTFCADELDTPDQVARSVSRFITLMAQFS